MDDKICSNNGKLCWKYNLSTFCKNIERYRKNDICLWGHFYCRNKLIHPAALDVVLSCYSVIQPQHSWEQRSTPADNPYAILTTINQSINQSIIEWPFFKITYYNHWRCEYLPPPKMEVIFSGPAVRQPVIASPLAPWVHQTARYTLCKKRKYPLVNVVASLC